MLGKTKTSLALFHWRIKPEEHYLN